MNKTNINRKAWGMLLLFTLLNVLSYADRFLIMAFSDDIIKDLSLTYFQYTILTGYAFTIFYTIAGLFMGALTDRVHRPRLMAAGLFAWTFLTALTGFTKNFFQVSITRAFVGVGEATLTPSALSMLSEVFSSTKRGFASAIFYLGLPVGTFVSFLLAASLGSKFGWRGCFFLMGVVGVTAIAFLLMLKDRRENHKDKPKDKPAFVKETLKDFLRTLSQTRGLLLVLLASVFITFTQGALVLDQVWLIKERGFSQSGARQFSGIIYLTGGVIGSIVAGIGSDWFQKKWHGGRVLFLAVSYLLATPLVIAYRLAPPDSLAFICTAFLLSMSVMFALAPVIATVQEFVPRRILGKSIAICIFAFSVFGNATGSAVTGWLSDQFTRTGVSGPLTMAMLMTSLPAVIAVILYYAAYLKIVSPAK